MVVRLLEVSILTNRTLLNLYFVDDSSLFIVTLGIGGQMVLLIETVVSSEENAIAHNTNSPLAPLLANRKHLETHYQDRSLNNHHTENNSSLIQPREKDD